MPHGRQVHSQDSQTSKTMAYGKYQDIDPIYDGGWLINLEF